MEKSVKQTSGYPVSKKDSPEFEINESDRIIKEARFVVLVLTLSLPFMAYYEYDGISHVGGLVLSWGSILISVFYVVFTLFIRRKPYTVTLATLGAYILLLIIVACFDLKAVLSESATQLLIIYVFYHGLREYKKAEKWLGKSARISS